MFTSLSPSLSSSLASTQTEVVPSPTSSSWTLEMLTRIFAAALSREMDLRMVAPSFVTVISPVVADSREGQVEEGGREGGIEEGLLAKKKEEEGREGNEQRRRAKEGFG
jgi:hypothetical protein